MCIPNTNIDKRYGDDLNKDQETQDRYIMRLAKLCHFYRYMYALSNIVVVSAKVNMYSTGLNTNVLHRACISVYMWVYCCTWCSVAIVMQQCT